MKGEATGGKLVSIQFLRAIAALAVALLHILGAFAAHIGDGIGFAPPDLGQAAVMLFFVVSGYVMVISSSRLFGQPDSTRIFLIRRLVRIMPPYWIASFALLFVFLVLFPQPVEAGSFIRSLFLIPAWESEHGLRSLPFLWPGWTLFYELVFYSIFAIFIAKGKSVTLAGVTIGLLFLTLGGQFIGPELAPQYNFIWTLTRPILLVFLCGVWFAVLRQTGWQAPAWLRISAFIASVLCAILVPEPADAVAMGWDYLAHHALPAVLLGFAIVSGPLELPAKKLINTLGDASYALYLLHVPIAWGWLWFYPKLPFFDAGPWDYFFTASLVAIVVSWLFYIAIEKPMMNALNRWFGSSKVAKP